MSIKNPDYGRFWRRSMRSEWPETGVACVRRFLKSDTTVRLSTLVGDVYQLLEGPEGQALDATNTLASNFRGWHGVHIASLQDFLKDTRPLMLSQLDLIIDEVGENVSRLLREPWRRFDNRSWFRRLHNSDRSLDIPWHIDADAASTAALEPECINVWLPLNETKNGVPSLQFVPQSHHFMRRQPLIELGGVAAFRPDQWVEANFPKNRWTPQLSPGDAILFDHYVLHRTAPGRCTGRLSCEFRFAKAHARSRGAA